MPVDTPCVEYQGFRNSKGYGVFSKYVGNYKSKQIYMHRQAWEKANGKAIPEGMYVLHLCDNPPCINPEHLELGTAKENAQQMYDRGRGSMHIHNMNGENHHMAKLTEDDVRYIRKRYAEGQSQGSLAREFKMSASTISVLVRHKIWKRVRQE